MSRCAAVLIFASLVTAPSTRLSAAPPIPPTPAPDWNNLLEVARSDLLNPASLERGQFSFTCGEVDFGDRTDCVVPLDPWLYLLAIEEYAERPADALQDAAHIKDPYYRSLALGGIAAQLRESDPPRAAALLAEAFSVAGSARYWVGKDASSLPYLIDLLSGFEPKTTRSLLNVAWTETKNRGFGNTVAEPFEALARLSVTFEPERLEERLKQDLMPHPDSFHYSGAIRVIARALTRTNEAHVRELFEACKRDHNCGTADTSLYSGMLMEIATRDFERGWKEMTTAPEFYRDVNTQYDLALELIDSNRPDEARRILRYFEQQWKVTHWIGFDTVSEQLRKRLKHGRETIPQTPRLITHGSDLVSMFKGAPAERQYHCSEELRFTSRSEAAELVRLAMRGRTPIVIGTAPRLELCQSTLEAAAVYSGDPSLAREVAMLHPVRATSALRMYVAARGSQQTRSSWPRAEELSLPVARDEMR